MAALGVPCSMRSYPSLSSARARALSASLGAAPAEPLAVTIAATAAAVSTRRAHWRITEKHTRSARARALEHALGARVFPSRVSRRASRVFQPDRPGAPFTESAG